MTEHALVGNMVPSIYISRTYGYSRVLVLRGVAVSFPNAHCVAILIVYSYPLVWLPFGNAPGFCVDTHTLSGYWRRALSVRLIP